MNITVCLICMALGSVYPATAVAAGFQNTDPSATDVPYGPVITQAFAAPTPGGPVISFASSSAATMNIVYAYGGASMFVELLGEMKNPREFWKALICCELIIIGVYMTFGVVFYSEQGQFVDYFPQFGIYNLAARQACNAFSLITGIVAAVMYGNTGMKVVYFQVIEDLLDGPKLGTRKGTFTWVAFVIFFWWLAYIIAQAVPDIGDLVGIVGALCIMSYSYTLPPIMQFGYYWQQENNLRDKIMKLWWLKAFDMTIFLGALAATGLGLWASIQSMINDVAAGATNNLSCP
jgi:hypothetical protein